MTVKRIMHMLTHPIGKGWKSVELERDRTLAPRRLEFRPDQEYDSEMDCSAYSELQTPKPSLRDLFFLRLVLGVGQVHSKVVIASYKLVQLNMILSAASHVAYHFSASLLLFPDYA